MQDLFSDNTPSVESERILYTPSTFARSSLLHLQEVGSLKAISAHTSSRKDLVSFLCFVVLDGCGELAYEGNTYFLKKGDCVFIDCRKAYSHRTGATDSVDVDTENYGHCSGVIFMPRFFQRFMRSIRSEGEDQYFIQRIWQSSGNFFQKCICLLLLRTIFGICG